MAEAYNSGQMFDPAIDSEADVLAIRVKAISLMRQGIQTMSWTGEGVSSTKQFVFPVADVLYETRLFLKRINPTKYGYISTTARQFRF